MLYHNKYPVTKRGMFYLNEYKENIERKHYSDNDNENDSDLNNLEESTDETEYEGLDKFDNDLKNQNDTSNEKSNSKPSNESDVTPSNKGFLNWSQIQKIDFLLNERYSIDGQGNFPALNVSLKDFITKLKNKLIEKNVFVNDVRINGGMASYILTSDKSYSYSDIDIIFSCNLSKDLTNGGEKCDGMNECAADVIFDNKFDLIKFALFDCLMDLFNDLLPAAIVKDKLMVSHLKDAYIVKMIKIVNSQDCWSLICLRNNDGRNIELKFVEKMKRQFQFSVDSFQIILDRLLKFYNTNQRQSQNLNEQRFPQVECESMYGDFFEAFNHLEKKLIATKLPEEIRGGGLLKYCNLLIRGYRQAYSMDIEEKYMCSRFFIDYNDIDAQSYTLSTYLRLHFQNEPALKLKYLSKLHEIVNKSTVCLMNHERQQTLTLIDSLRHTEELKLYPNNNSGYYYLAPANYFLPYQNNSKGHYNLRVSPNYYQKDTNSKKFVEYYHASQYYQSTPNDQPATYKSTNTSNYEKTVKKTAESFENFNQSQNESIDRPKGFLNNSKSSNESLNQLDTNARQLARSKELSFAKASPSITSLSSPMSDTFPSNNSSVSLNYLSSNSSISSSPSVSPLPYYHANSVQNGVCINEVQNSNHFYLIEHPFIHKAKPANENISMFQCKIPISSRIEIHYNFYNPPPFLYAFINQAPETYDSN